MDDSRPAYRADRRSHRPKKTNLKEDLANILQSEDLSRKMGFLQSVAEENDTDLGHVAAALLTLVEKNRRDQMRQSERRFSSGPGGPRPTTRGARPPQRDSGPRFGDRRPSRGMTKYRIEVGREHGVGPGQIVAAIANESVLSGSDIGGIHILSHHSTVDLPQDMSPGTVSDLEQVVVAGQPLRLSKLAGAAGSDRPGRHEGFQRRRGTKPTWKKSRKRTAPPKGDRGTPGAG